MTVVAQLPMEPAIRFDFAFLRKGAVYFSIMMLVVSPFSHDPVATVFCGIVPWVLISLVDRPGMPAAAVYYLLWQWVQTAVRLLLAFIDGESSDNAPWIYQALRPLARVLKPFQSLYVSGEDIGRAMLQATQENVRGRVIENAEIRASASRSR